jgi:hypothetical protein
MAILKIKDENGNWISIPSIKGDKGDKGDAGQIEFIVVTELPTKDINENAIYMKPSTNQETQNTYEEFIYVNDEWESLGVAQVEADLTEYAKKKELPTKTSELTNDSGFITEEAIPTKTSELTNDSGFITESIDTLPVGSIVDYEGDTVPDGYEEAASIVESGSNENGSWTKWEDGTMLCEHRVYSSHDTTTSYGALYMSELITLPDFPVEFIERPRVILQYETADWASSIIFGVASIGYPTKKNVGQLRLISGVSSSSNGGYIVYIAKGKWK